MKLTYHLCCAEYLGGAITCDAYHMTDPRADGLGVSTCIELALKDAGIEKEQVQQDPSSAMNEATKLTWPYPFLEVLP